MKVIFSLLILFQSAIMFGEPIMKYTGLTGNNRIDSFTAIIKDPVIPDSTSSNNYSSDNQNNENVASESKPDQKENSKVFINNPVLAPGLKTDSVFLFQGEIYLADVKKITMTNIYFTHPGEMDLYNVERKEVKMIVYKDGVKEIVNTVKREPKTKEWKELKITDNPLEVEGLLKAGKINAFSTTEKQTETSNDELERSAMIILKKKASNLNADVILITEKLITRGYGDFPSMTIKAVAYKFQ